MYVYCNIRLSIWEAVCDGPKSTHDLWTIVTKQTLTKIQRKRLCERERERGKLGACQLMVTLMLLFRMMPTYESKWVVVIWSNDRTLGADHWIGPTTRRLFAIIVALVSLEVSILSRVRGPPFFLELSRQLMRWCFFCFMVRYSAATVHSRACVCKRMMHWTWSLDTIQSMLLSDST